MDTKVPQSQIDSERTRKLFELAEEQGTTASEILSQLIDQNYEQSLGARRKSAAQEIGRLKIEDVPDSSPFSHRLADSHAAQLPTP